MAEALAGLGDARWARDLALWASKGNEAFRDSCGRELLKRLGGGAVDVLVGLGLEGSGDDDVTRAALWGFQVLSPNSAIEILGSRLKSEDWRIRRQAVRLLGMLKDGAALPWIDSALRDPIPRVRRAAARALAVHGTTEALCYLESIALTEADEETRRIAQRAIAGEKK